MWLALVLVMIGSYVPADATPFTWGDNVPPQKWPAGATINVWIQNIDPQGPNSRQQLFADGINRWAAELDRGYTINVNLGDPPSGTNNLVKFTWAAPGTALSDPNLILNGNDGITEASSDGTKIVSARGIIDNTLTTNSPSEREYIRNLGMHEFTHALGLADDTNGRVTNHEVQNDGNAMQFNDQDRAEITQLYGRPSGGGPKGIVQRINAGGGTGMYIYDYNFEGDRNEHVSLITLHIDPELVRDVKSPEGWLFLDPRYPTHYQIEPYYKGYMEDGTTNPSPWSLTDPVNYLAFRSSGPQYNLTLDNPYLTITVFTENDMVGQITTWSGIDLQWVDGPVRRSVVTPSVSQWGLIILAALLLAAGTIAIVRRRQRVSA
jgi:hypothetical protein